MPKNAIRGRVARHGYTQLMITDADRTKEYTFNLLPLLDNWDPGVTTPKDDGVWVDNKNADSRVLRHASWSNVGETFELSFKDFDVDALYVDMSKFRRLLVMAQNFWTGGNKVKKIPLYIVARSDGETEERWSLIMNWSSPVDGNPYAQPLFTRNFLKQMNGRDIVIEREPFWNDKPHSDPDCVKLLSEYTYNNVRNYLTYLENTDRTRLGGDPQWDDLPLSTSFSIDIFVKKNTDYVKTANTIISKHRNSPYAGWWLYTDSSGRLWFIAPYSGTNMSASSVETVLYDGDWHHVRVTLNWTAKTCKLYIDGTEVTYNTHVTGVGTYVTDAGVALYIANIDDTSLSFQWQGDITNLRIRTSSDAVLDYELCDTYSVGSTTLGFYPHSTGYGGAALYDEYGTRDGTITGADWGREDCDVEYIGPSESTCDEEIYIGNMHSNATITDVYYYDASAGTWSTNRIGSALPYDLLPAVPAAGDYVVFGMKSDVLDYSGFYNLIFDLLVAQYDLTVYWIYCDGTADPTGWPQLDVQDNTDDMENTGVNSVHWNIPSDFDKANPTTAGNSLGITGYWVGLYVNAVGGSPDSPQQQNIDVYTINNNEIIVPEDEIGGDYAVFHQMKIRNQSDVNYGDDEPESYANDFTIGLRSVDRGDNFVSIINLGNAGNPTFISVVRNASYVTLTEDIEVPSKWKSVVSNLPAAATEVLSIEFDPEYAKDFFGDFKVFLRGRQTSGSLGNIRLRLIVSIGGYDDGIRKTGEYKEFMTMSGSLPTVIDFEGISLPPTDEFLFDDYFPLVISIEGIGNASDDFELYDIALIPVDEWAGRFYTVDSDEWYSNGGKGYGLGSTYLDIDPITKPKSRRRSVLYTTNTFAGDPPGEFKAFTKYASIQNKPSSLNIENEQKLYVFACRTDYFSTFSTVNTMLSFKQQKYFSMRGDR